MNVCCNINITINFERRQGTVLCLHEYDIYGNVTYMQDAGGGEWHYAYDFLGRKISETDANGHTTKYTYDANGNRTGIIYPNGLIVEMMYDAVNRMMGVSTTGTTVVNGETKSRKLTVHYDYDVLGSQILYLILV